MRRKDKILLTISGFLMLFCVGLEIAIQWKPEIKAEKANEKDVLYSAPLPPLPEAAEDSININTASFEELMKLPGIGEKMAERILKYREENGDFLHPASIMEVRGIGEKMYEKLKTKIKVQ